MKTIKLDFLLNSLKFDIYQIKIDDGKVEKKNIGKNEKLKKLWENL